MQPLYALCDADKSAPMIVTVNGEEQRFSGPLTVAGLVTMLMAGFAEEGRPKGRIAIERNLEVVPRSAWTRTALAHGDRIEVVHFVGGG